MLNRMPLYVDQAVELVAPHIEQLLNQGVIDARGLVIDGYSRDGRLKLAVKSIGVANSSTPIFEARYAEFEGWGVATEGSLTVACHGATPWCNQYVADQIMAVTKLLHQTDFENAGLAWQAREG